MRAYDLTHLADAVLRRDLPALVAQQRAPTAIILAHIAEYDARGLFLGDGYSSMFAYCVDELRTSDDVAYIHIKVARYARRFPLLFAALADGRLHLSGARLIGPHLTSDNVEELVAASAGQTRSKIQELIFARFAQRQSPAKQSVVLVMPTPEVRKQVPGPVDDLFAQPTNSSPEQPIAPPEERFEIRFSTGRAAHDRLRYAQSLLSHTVPSGDLEQIYDRAVICLIAQQEKLKFAKTERPRSQGQNSGRQNSRRKRHIPSAVKRAVSKRDQGRCTFVSETGHRCGADKFLEYDHVRPVALGGKATVDNLRLRCRAHNQYEAEKVFGAEFVRQKRATATAARGRARPA